MTLDQNTKIRYSVEDKGQITSFTLTLEEIENEKLYAILHDTEQYTCLAKVIKRELVIDEPKR